MRHRWLTGFRTGQLYVSMIQDITPGEVWHGSTTSVCRIDPLNKPTFMEYNIFRRKFFVPYRILDSNFVEWWLGQNDAYTHPTLNIGTTGAVATNTYHLLGISPSPLRAVHNVTAYPLYAYNMIWNKFYRPEGVNEVALNTETIHRVVHPNSSYYGNMRDSMQLGSAVTVSSTTNFDIPTLRDAWAKQRLQEHRKLFGDKYIDRLRYFGCKVPNSLVDEPVPVSSGKGVMGISEVVETANTGADGGFPGQLAGHGITSFQDRLTPRKFVEPGLLMEVCYARPRLALQGNLNRLWLKHEEPVPENAFYNPECALKSDAIVHSDEIYSAGSAANTNFAYTDNYDWLRSANDVVGGVMNTSTNLEWSGHKRQSAVPNLSTLQYVDDYDALFQNGSSTNRADVKLYAVHNLKKLSPIRPRGRS